MKALIVLSALLASVTHAQVEKPLNFEDLLKEKTKLPQLLQKPDEDRLRVKTISGKDMELFLGGSGAHGGDYNEIPIHNLGWDILEALKNSEEPSVDTDLYADTLTNLKIKVVDSLELNSVNREAVNVPDENLWYLTREGYRFLTNPEVSFKEKSQFFLHEFLPLMNISDRGYQTSKRIVRDLKEHNKRSMTHVLASIRFDGPFDGVSYSQADGLCERIKRDFKREYFAVFCLYQEKYREHFIPTWRTYTYYHYFYGRYYYRRSVTTYSERYVLEGPLWGLKVVGFGKLDQLKEKKVLDGDITEMPTYRSAAEAKMRCTEIRAVKDDTDFNYYNSKCQPFPVEGGFKFHIVTKNPLIQ